MEVVLNKPSIKYNVSILDDLENVVRLEGRYGVAYAYRSHYNTSILVIVSLQSLTTKEDADRYLAIRIESPMKKEVLYRESCSTEIKLNEVITIDKEEAKALGWSYDLPTELNLSENSKYIKGYLHKVIDSTNIRIHIISSEDIGTIISITMTVRDRSEFSKAVTEVKSLLNKAFKPSIDVKEDQFTCKETTYQVLRPIFSEDELKQALMNELKWLSKIGVISGLSDEEISRIIESIRIGYAGWNSRLIYFDGRWVSYADVVNLIEGAVLLKTYGCSTYVDESMLPMEAPKYIRPQTSLPTSVATNSNSYDSIAIIISLAIAIVATTTAYLLITRRR